MPTADQVAHVVIAAAREMGVDPVRVVTLMDPRGVSRAEYQATARARVYAGYTLCVVYRVSGPAAARMVGISKHSAAVWMSTARASWGAWFDKDVARRVRDCAPAEDSVVSKNEITERQEARSGMERFSRLGDVTPSPRMPGKGKLYDILAEAVANTRAMQDRLDDGKAED